MAAGVQQTTEEAGTKTQASAEGACRLTLTKEERRSIEEAMDGYEAWMEDNVCWHKPEVQAVLYHLRGILERAK